MCVFLCYTCCAHCKHAFTVGRLGFLSAGWLAGIICSSAAIICVMFVLVLNKYLLAVEDDGCATSLVALRGVLSLPPFSVSDFDSVMLMQRITSRSRERDTCSVDDEGDDVGCWLAWLGSESVRQDSFEYRVQMHTYTRHICQKKGLRANDCALCLCARM